MKEIIFSNESRIGRFFFRKMLGWLESDSRLRLNNPGQLAEASGVKNGQRVLEVGCGSGFFTPALSELVGKTGFIESIDLHPAAVEQTTEKLSKLNADNVRVTLGDAHCTGFPDESFDMVIVYGVVPAPVISEERLGAELERLLKPDGIISVWTLAPLWRPTSIMKHSTLEYCGKTGNVHRIQKPAA